MLVTCRLRPASVVANQLRYLKSVGLTVVDALNPHNSGARIHEDIDLVSIPILPEVETDIVFKMGK